MSDRDRKLAEMMGVHWNLATLKCGDALIEPFTNPDFSTPEWRAKLMDWAVEQEWWDKFVWQTRWKFLNKWENGDFLNRTRDGAFNQYLWRNLPDLVDEYWRETGR